MSGECTGPHTFQHLYGLDSREDVRDQAAVHRLGMSRSLTLISADNVVIFAETLDILLEALGVLNEESEPLGLRVSWVKTKIQAFNDILDLSFEPENP